jgi:hypothetical protein
VGAASELSGRVGAEATAFFSSPLLTEQQWHSASLVLEPEYYHEWSGGSSFTLVPFVRLDSANSGRSHLEMRELSFLWLADALSSGSASGRCSGARRSSCT